MPSESSPRARRRGSDARRGVAPVAQVALAEMEWDDELAGGAGAFTWECPCGDVFQITAAALLAGEEVADCPSCSLWVLVRATPEELAALAEAAADGARDPLLAPEVGVGA